MNNRIITNEEEVEEKVVVLCLVIKKSTREALNDTVRVDESPARQEKAGVVWKQTEMSSDEDSQGAV